MAVINAYFFLFFVFPQNDTFGYERLGTMLPCLIHMQLPITKLKMVKH